MYHSKENTTAAHRSGGFTLIEVLVAVLVLSIGMLGVASLQATSMRHNNDASMQTQATFILSDMADRMRANSSQAGNYPTSTPTAASGNCLTGTCTSAEMVENDLFEWNALVANTLPAGQGTVTAIAGGLFTITVLWDQDHTGVTGTNCDPNDPTDLRCLSITTQP